MSSKDTPSPVIRLGIIGAGGRLRGVLSGILQHALVGQIRVVSAYDPAPESLLALKGLVGYDFEHARSEDDVIRHPEVDWVFIGSWNCFHARQAVAALEAGKHVFCEKPLATTFEDCLAIRDAAARTDRVFAFGLVLRYAPHYARIHEIVDSGALGKIVSFEFNETIGFNHGGYIFGDWRRLQSQAGSHILEKCCHDLDLANWLTGSVPVRVASFGGRNFFVPENAGRVQEIGPNETGLPAYHGWPWASAVQLNPFTSEAEICDNQVVILEYASGARATFHANCNAGIPERRMYVLGDRAALRADLNTGIIEIGRIGWNSEIEKIDTGANGGHGGGDETMTPALVRTMLQGEPPLASVNEGICSTVTALGIDQSLAEGRIVDLMPFWKEAGINVSDGLARCKREVAIPAAR
jgi:predicted dehydrogenase